MKAAEYLGSITKPIDELGGMSVIEFYGASGRTAAPFDMRGDLIDAIWEGYVELDVTQVSKFYHGTRSFRVSFDDGYVRVWADDANTIHAKLVEAPKPAPRTVPTVRRPSPFERTRAAVYATGNRWAIENFNATH